MAKRSKTPAKALTGLVRSSAAEYLTFMATTSGCGVKALHTDESIWLSRKMMETLYDVEPPITNYHLKKVFFDSVLKAEAVIRKFPITAADGKNYNTLHYKSGDDGSGRNNNEVDQ